MPEPGADAFAPDVGSAPGWPLVLYFHHVHPQLEHYTSLTPDDFRRALDTALTHVGPGVEPSRLASGEPPPDHPTVLVTFDDGYRDNLRWAVPILAEFDVRMVLFCITGSIDAAASAPPGPDDPWGFLDWDGTERVRAAGHLVGAHTVTHRRLTELPPAEARGEVTDSLARLGERLGAGPRPFAYPYGAVPAEPPVPANVPAFGTVRSPARAWDREPHRIRRTYLPTGETDRWAGLARNWRRQWFDSR